MVNGHKHWGRGHMTDPALRLKSLTATTTTDPTMNLLIKTQRLITISPLPSRQPHYSKDLDITVQRGRSRSLLLYTHTHAHGAVNNSIAVFT